MNIQLTRTNMKKRDDRILKKLFASLQILSIIRIVTCSQGLGTDVLMDAKVHCSSLYKVTYTVASELQCFHRCLRKSKCHILNYKSSQGISNAQDNCEVYDMPLEKALSCYTISSMPGWKSVKMKVSIICSNLIPKPI